MIDQDFQGIVEAYQLGELKGTPRAVTGGRKDFLWQMATNQGLFAVKRLRRVSGEQRHYEMRYRTSQIITEAFIKRGTPAVPALYQPNGDLFYLAGEAVYRVFPWVAAAEPVRAPITPRQCELVSGIMADMHRAHIKIRCGQPWHFPFDAAEWEKLLSKSKAKNMHFAILFEHELPRILEVCAAYEETFNEANKTVVISHRDLDCNNVVWVTPEKPVLIDWDAVGEIDPGVELLFVALAWSFEPEFKMNMMKFDSILKAYHAIHPIGFVRFDVLLHQVFANWLNWLRRELILCLYQRSELSFRNLLITEVINTLECFRLVNNKYKDIKQTWEKRVCK